MQTIGRFLSPYAVRSNPSSVRIELRERGNEILAERGGRNGPRIVTAVLDAPSVISNFLLSEGWTEIPEMVSATRRKTVYINTSIIEGPGEISEDDRAAAGLAVAQILDRAREAGAKSAWVLAYSDTLTETEIAAFWNGAGFTLVNQDRDHRPVYYRAL